MYRKYLAFAAAGFPLLIFAFVNSEILAEQRKNQYQPNDSQLLRKKDSVQRNQSTNSNHLSAKDDLPLLILHIGPRNTGAATIQWFATNHEDLFEKDNIHFVGYNSSSSPPEWSTHQLYVDCSVHRRDKDDIDCSESWDQMSTILNHHESNKQNVFISDELFSDYTDQHDEAEHHLWSHFLPLVQDKWRVHVIFTYRRYYEWIHSRYSQMYNPEQWEFGGEMADIWPFMDSRQIRSFQEFVDGVKHDNFKYPPTTMERWSSRFNDVSVFNLHDMQNGNLVEKFFCDMVPEAPHVCKFLQGTQKNDDWGRPRHPSTSMVHQYEVITMEAYKRNWINKDNHSPAEAIKAVEAYAKNHGYKKKTDFPLTCLAKKKVDYLLEKSLSMEKQMVPDFFKSKLGQNALKADFNKAKDDGLFCSIDVAKIMSNMAWETFFMEHFGAHPFWTDTNPTAATEVDASHDSQSYYDKFLPVDYPQLDVELSWMGIGAQGAGTTWLAHMLMDCCPSVSFALHKEVHFWDYYRQNGLGWYSRQFSNRTIEEGSDKVYHGEITPFYLALPDEDIREVRALFPKVKIIFLARDLVDRTWSGLRKMLIHDYKQGKEKSLNPADYPDDYFMSRVKQGVLKRSDYAQGINNWYAHFPQDQILILNFADIAKDPSGMLKKALDHIGVKGADKFLKSIEEEEQEVFNQGKYTSLRPSLRKKLEDVFRPFSQEFNVVLRKNGYSWRLDEY